MNKEYWYIENEQQVGPFKLNEFLNKNLNEDTIIWFEGLNDWTEFKNVKSQLTSKVPPEIIFDRKIPIDKTIIDKEIKPIVEDKNGKQKKYWLIAGILFLFISVFIIVFQFNKKPEIEFIRIGNLEVMTKDLGEMNWEEAKKACEALGDGWRLPTRDEWSILYENKNIIGGFDSSYYWSSTEYTALIAHLFISDVGRTIWNNKSGVYSVRGVRDF